MAFIVSAITVFSFISMLYFFYVLYTGGEK